ncbi:hypothetical protein CDL12_25091 [Handroanthus impetiginosus]|uniref:F-box domain-containing protein n=1 Tax=Handroanthus impetiginosus TaxID=429701 RepID=A0A2G9GB21_9LAMI|nr:hypothetical protein CDL12_25091 [Handroanthus impetiginosus]
MPNAKFCVMNSVNLPSSGSYIVELPTDLILEIFFKLSTRDLLCSMGVCKSWYNLIANPDFTNNYTRNSHFTTIVLSKRSYNFKNFFLLEIAPSGEFIQTPIKSKVPTQAKTDSMISVIGLLDGLLFLLLRRLHDHCDLNKVKEEVYIINPLFRGCFKLEDCRIVDKGSCLTQYKLGFVPSTNKFKLLRIVFQDDRRFQEANIFSVGEDVKWRKLEEPLSLLSKDTQGSYFNGAYHYFVKDDNDVHIHTFDFGKEKGGQISKRPGLLRKYWKRRLTSLDNRLCLVEFPINFDEMIIWAMEEYGVSLSWSRKILLQSWFPSNIDFAELIPLELLGNGDFLLLDWLRSKLVRFNRETKKFSEIKVSDRNFQSFPREITSYATVYAPRFYSIRRDIARGLYGVLEMSD